jgi:hypothetical protein
MISYVIINKSEVSSLDFDTVLNTNSELLRYSLDGSQAIVKYEGTQPFDLLGKTEYTEESIKDVVSGLEWYDLDAVI